METMYDRLGELLNETLEAGQVRFVSTSALQDAQEASGVQAGSAQEEDALHSGARQEARTGAGSQEGGGSDNTHQAGGGAHGDSATLHTGTYNAAHTSRRRSGGTASTHDAAGEGSASSRSGGSSLHDGSPQHRTHTQRRQGRPGGTAGVHTARSDQASFRPFASEPHTSGAQGSGGQAESYTFRQFTVPRVATMNEEVMRALRLLDLTDSATLEDVKRAYKEKLKYFHPDKYDKNEVLKTVATKKTRMIVDAYELLCKHFAPPSGDS